MRGGWVTEPPGCLAADADMRVQCAGMTAVIFDLDNCLAPATAVGEALYGPAFAAIRKANDGRIAADALAAAFRQMWTHAYDWVADRYGFTPAMRAAGWQALVQIEVTGPLAGYGDLNLLASVPGERFLVTTGLRRLQDSKIRGLGIAAQFREIFIDAIDEPRRLGKAALFQHILVRSDLKPADVIVVGDNPDSELAAARQVGLRAVQMLRPGVARSEANAECVADLRELIRWLAANT